MIAQTATQTAQSIATVTLKATGLTYILYPMFSRTSDATYAVWTINNKPVHCTCKDRKYRPYKMCDHMKQWLAEQGNTSPAPMPYTAGLKTSFSSIEEEYEYRLHAYGKKSAVHWAYEQKQHTEVSVVPTGQAEQVAAVAEVQAEAKMDAFKRGMDEQYASDPRTELAKQIEARETAESNLRAYYNGL